MSRSPSAVASARSNQHQQHREHAERGAPDPDLSNVDADGNMIDPDDTRMIYHSANQMWHTDSSFKRVPALASMLSGRECPPEGGETEYASMRVAYDRLSDEMRRTLEGRIAVHSFAYSRGLVAKDLLRPEDEAQVRRWSTVMIRSEPVNGRKSIFVASHASHIVGMAVEEGRALIRFPAHRAGDRTACIATRGRPGIS
jgi:alpha-ketoglutarate-dependent 2,4-dichlorophenoxyacetate dioxygenase